MLCKFNLLSAYGISLNNPLRGASPKAAYLASKRTCVRQLTAFMPNSQTNRNFIPLNCVLLQPNNKCRAGELFCGTRTFHNLCPFVITRRVLCFVLLSSFCKKKSLRLTHCWTRVKNFSTQILVVERLAYLFCTSGSVCPGFPKSEWIDHLHVSSPVCNGFLRFTSGAAPTDLLTAIIAAEPF